MRHILSTSIAALLAPCIIGTPRPAYGPDDIVAGTPGAFGEGQQGRTDADRPDVQLNVNDKVQGEEPPDFSFIDSNEPAPPAAPAPGKPASEPPPAAPEPKPGETAPTPKPPEEGGKAPKVPITDPNDELPVPPVVPPKETTEQPVPDPQAEAAKAEAEKKAAAEQAATDKTAQEKAAADKKAAEDAAAKAGKAPEVKLPTEEEVDAMVPKPGAPKQVIADFKRLKDDVVKPALAEVKRLKAELEARASATVTPEVEARLKQAEDDRVWREAFELENDPKMQKEFADKTTKAETDLYATLGRFGMKAESIEELKKVGLDSDKGREFRGTILKTAQEKLDPIAFDEIKDAFKARDGVRREQAAKIEELRGKQGDLVTAKAEAEKAERMAWAGECDKKLIAAVADEPMFLLKEITATMSEAEKKAAEAHNKSLNDELVPKMHEGIRALYARDPDKTMSYLVDSMKLPHIERERDGLAKELAEAQKRIAELEGDAGKLRRVSSVSQANGAPPPAKPNAAQPDTAPSDMSAEDAIDQYRKEKGLYPGNQGAVKL